MKVRNTHGMIPFVVSVPPKPSAFDKAVDAKVDATVRRVRANAARDAIAFLNAKPVD